jgi:hypothetical protein
MQIEGKGEMNELMATTDSSEPSAERGRLRVERTDGLKAPVK